MLTRLKEHMKKLLPKKLILRRRKRLLFKAARGYAAYDRNRYLKWNGIVSQDVATLWARVTRLQHILEKAFALPEPRRGFGEWVIEELLQVLPMYVQQAGLDQAVRRSVLILRKYVDFHNEFGIIAPCEHEITSLLNTIPSNTTERAEAEATIAIDRDKLLEIASIGFADFALCRHSVRQFASDVVPNDLIIQATRIAQKSPSVCNRQGSRVHIYCSDDLKSAILKIHSGNRGFGHLASHVIVITFDLRCLLDPGERHQAWIDGGLFGMSLLYGIHSLGLGACPLHWSVAPQDDMALRSVADIPEHEEIIMLVAVGSLPRTFAVAASARRNLHEVARVH